MISEIRKKAKTYSFNNDGYGYDLNTCEDIYTDGAEYGYQLAVNKACEWLENKLPQAMVRSDYYMFNGGFIKDFKKAMEE